MLLRTCKAIHGPAQSPAHTQPGHCLPPAQPGPPPAAMVSAPGHLGTFCRICRWPAVSAAEGCGSHTAQPASAQTSCLPAGSGGSGRRHPAAPASHRGSPRHVHRLLVLGHVASPHAPLLAHRAVWALAGGNHPLPILVEVIVGGRYACHFPRSVAIDGMHWRRLGGQERRGPMQERGQHVKSCMSGLAGSLPCLPSSPPSIRRLIIGRRTHQHR